VSGGGRVSDNGLVSTEPAEPAEPAEPDEAALVARAVDGDTAALEEVISLLSDPLYRLALRMSWRPADAEDATQEILIRVVTRLATWRGEARLLTWAYRIGVNYLLNLRRKTPQEAHQFSLDEFGASLADGLADADYRGPEAAVLAEEVRLSCTQAMLQCLERGERIAFVLSDVFELSSADAAWILETTPAAYRKRLERARHRIGAFMNSTCGLVNPDAFCRCARRVPKALATGRIDPRRPTLTAHPVTPSGRGVAEDLSQRVARLAGANETSAALEPRPDMDVD